MMEEKNDSRILRSKSYFTYLIFVPIFVDILDTYTTNWPNVVPSQYIRETKGVDLGDRK